VKEFVEGTPNKNELDDVKFDFPERPLSSDPKPKIPAQRPITPAQMPSLFESRPVTPKEIPKEDCPPTPKVIPVPVVE
jgi:hypothetical protein